MGAAGIELPDFVTEPVVERAYRRSLELQRSGEGSALGRALRIRGMNMARDRNGRFLKFLELGAEILRRKNDEQAGQFKAHGYAKTDFNEYTTWRTAYEKAVDPEQHERTMFKIWGWVYAAVAEALS
jgi:hypothetical protein